MLQDNIFLQVLLLVTLSMLLVLLICSFIPYFEFEIEEDNPTLFCAFIVLLILALLRGSF